MRILLVLDRVENPASANALMGFRLAEQLLRRDHTVHILTLWDGLHTPPAPPEGAMQHLLAFADERQMNEALENGQKGGTPVPLRLARLVCEAYGVDVEVLLEVLEDVVDKHPVDEGASAGG